jgi:large exoprotein involved in heme utilization and adhesion
MFATTPQGAVGSGGDIIITTGSLSVSDQGRISTRAQGQGNAGNIQIQANGTVSFDGGDAISTLEQGAVGKGGDIDITARSLSLVNGSQLSSATSGEGTAGNIRLSANTVGLSSGGRLLTTTSSNGQAGDITVNTPDLQLSGATSGLFAETTSGADAGNLTIQPLGNGQSVQVNLQDGAQISASTSSSGRGGTLMITAPESITLTGNGSIIAAETGGSGMGGNLNLQTGTLSIQNRAEVTVSSSGTGSAGSLFVDANQIYLDNQGRIRADTTGGGGNINLRSPLILLRNGSSITTDARGSNIPGGNISIDTDNLVAVPSENSDISANSANFRGGNVTVRASGLFGIEFREQLTPLSDITATGATSEFSGTVDIITPGIDPARGLAELPTGVVDASDAIAQGCRDVQGSSFVVTGRGGWPPTPQQALGDDPRWRDWRTPAGVSRQPNATRQGSLPPSANPLRTKSLLVEATGWMFGADGKVILTASEPHVSSPNRWGQPVNCDGS